MNNLTVKSIAPVDGININHRKEHSLDRGFIAIDRQGKEICELRTYWPANDCYACLWIHYNDIHATGSGRAGGGGYDKRSAAAAEAFTAAGVEITRFGSTGRTREAVEALARKLAGRKFLTVVEAYG